MTGAARTGFPDLRDRRERKVTGVVRKSKQADVPTANKETRPSSAWGISGLEFPFLSSWAWRRGAAGKLLLDTRTLW